MLIPIFTKKLIALQIHRSPATLLLASFAMVCSGCGTGRFPAIASAGTAQIRIEKVAQFDLGPHTGQDVTTSFDPGPGNTCYTQDLKWDIRLYDLGSGALVATIPSEGPELVLGGHYCATWSATKMFLGQVVIRDTSAGAAVVTTIPAWSTPWSVRFSPDAERILIGGLSGEASLYEVRTGARVRTFRAMRDGVDLAPGQHAASRFRGRGNALESGVC